jgi:hypothetical protein
LSRLGGDGGGVGDIAGLGWGAALGQLPEFLHGFVFWAVFAVFCAYAHDHAFDVGTQGFFLVLSGAVHFCQFCGCGVVLGDRTADVLEVDGEGLEGESVAEVEFGIDGAEFVETQLGGADDMGVDFFF